MLVDQYGNPIKPESRPETRTVAAASLRDRWSGYPSVGLTPERLAQIFQAADQGALQAQAELFEEMEEKDSHLASLLQTRKLAVASLDWRIEPASEEEQDQEIAEFVEVRLRAVANLPEAMLDLLDAIAKGYALVEIDWQVQQYAEPVFLRWVHPKRVTFWNSLTPAILEGNSLTGRILTPWKFIFHRYKGRSGHDTRAGMLRVVSWMYLLKNYSLKDWAAFNEIFGMPMRLGKYDPSATEADKAALVTAIRALGSDAAGVISKSTEIEFVEAATRLSGNYNPYQVMIEFCNREMSKAILGQTLTTDTTGTTGTYSSAKVHDEVRRDLMEADAEALAATLRAQLIRPLVGFNFGWEAPLPYFVFDLAEEEDQKQVAETYKILKEIGYPLTLEHLSERFNLPLPREGQEVASGQGPGARGQERDHGAGEGTTARWRSLAMPLRQDGAMEITPFDRPVIRAQVEMAALAEKAVVVAEDISTKMMAPVQELIEQGSDLEEVRSNLLAAYPHLAVGDLAELLYQGAVLAYMRGRERRD